MKKPNIKKEGKRWKPRIPLPKQVEQTFPDKKKYNRKTKPKILYSFHWEEEDENKTWICQ
jgi:hypothetical protein